MIQNQENKPDVWTHADTKLADKRCKKCNGLGYLGIKLDGNLRTMLICPCVAKAKMVAEAAKKASETAENGISEADK